MFDFDFDVLEEVDGVTTHVGDQLGLPLNAGTASSFAHTTREVEVRVCGLDGILCTLSVQRGLKTSQLKDLVEARLSIPYYEQRLCSGEKELRDEWPLPVGFCMLNITLIRIPLDHAEWMSQVRNQPLGFCEAPPPIKADRSVVLEAARGDVSVLAYASESLRTDVDFALTMVSLNGEALRYLPATMRANAVVVTAAVASAGHVLRYAAEDLRADPTIVLAAVRQNAKALMHAAPELLKDPEFTKLAARSSPFASNLLADMNTDQREREHNLKMEEAVLKRDEYEAELCKISVESAKRLLKHAQSIFLDARSNGEFEDSRICGAISLPDKSPALRRLIQHPHAPVHGLSLAVDQMMAHPGHTVIVYSDSGSDDLSLGYVSRCVHVCMELRSLARQRNALGKPGRILRLVGGLNEWKRVGLPVEGDARPRLNGSALVNGGIHLYLGLGDEND